MKISGAKKVQNLALLVFIFFIISPFSGCIQNSSNNTSPRFNKTGNEYQIKITYSTEDYTILQPLEINNKKLIEISPRSAFLLPLFATLFKNHKVKIEIKENGIEVPLKDYSYFSSRVAVTFWNFSNTCIVVASYKDALLFSPLSWILDAPLLVYGNTTKQVLSLMNCKNVISVDDLPVTASTKLARENILDYTISLAKENEIIMDYLLLVNANDSVSSVSYLSSMASLLSAYRNGAIIEVTNEHYQAGAILENNSTQILSRVREAANKIGAAYVCIVGSPDSVPFIIDETIVEPKEDVLVASDNYYGDMDNNPLFPELAVGRFLAADITDACLFFYRYVQYGEYLEENALEQLTWQNSAFLYTTATLESSIPSHAQLAVALIEKEFTVYQSHSYLSNILAQKLIETSNFILIADHGSYEGNDMVDFSGVALHPGVLFNTGCHTGHTDNVSLKKTSVCKAINSGIASYIGPTRIAWSGLRVGYYIDDNETLPIPKPYYRNMVSNALAKSFFECLLANVSVGIALKDAKNNYFNESFVIGGHPEKYEALDKVTLLEFALYGDPAFNPYEPCNEGKSN